MAVLVYRLDGGVVLGCNSRQSKGEIETQPVASSASPPSAALSRISRQARNRNSQFSPNASTTKSAPRGGVSESSSPTHQLPYTSCMEP